MSKRRDEYRMKRAGVAVEKAEVRFDEAAGRARAEIAALSSTAHEVDPAAVAEGVPGVCRVARFVASVQCGPPGNREKVIAIEGDAGVIAIERDELGLTVVRADRLVFVPWGNVREIVTETVVG